MRKTVLECVYELAKKDKRVVFVGSDLGAGVLQKFKDEMPERFFMEGVSEQAIVGICAGLAKEGHIVYFNTIATFITRRSFEQNVLDLGLHNLPVRLIGSGGGMVYAPLGSTHMAIDDIAIMRTIPNMSVIVPADAAEMRRMAMQTLDYPGPIYIRVAKGSDPIVTPDDENVAIGKAVILAEGKDGLIVTTGITLGLVKEAKEKLAKKKVNVGILHTPTIKPFDGKTLVRLAKKVKAVISVEEHLITGGLGSAVAEVLMESGTNVGFKRIGIPDVFPTGYGSQKEQMEKMGITAERIILEVNKILRY